MVNDDERRDVARRLRELPGDSTYPDLIGVIADHDGWYPASDAADRLADLIEPQTITGDTSDERREAARRLREFIKDNQWALAVGGNSSTIRHAISDIVFGDKKYHSGVDLLNRLADLIDPPAKLYDSPDSSNSEADMGRETAVDRDALLALADEIEYGASSDDGKYYDLPAIMVAAVARKQMEYARRIREACGEAVA